MQKNENVWPSIPTRKHAVLPWALLALFAMAALSFFSLGCKVPPTRIERSLFDIQTHLVARIPPEEILHDRLPNPYNNWWGGFSPLAANMGPLGGMSAKDRAAIEGNTKLSVGGNVIAPLTRDTMSADALNFVTMMKPLMENMLGQFGEGIEFLVYPNPPQGAEKISAVKPGSLSYTAFGHRYDWRLPIGSLLPPKIDEKTKPIFPGDYLFNPYTGEKLSEAPVQPGGPATGSRPIRQRKNERHRRLTSPLATDGTNWVAVGAAGTILVSPDATNWAALNPLPTSPC